MHRRDFLAGTLASFVPAAFPARAEESDTKAVRPIRGMKASEVVVTAYGARPDDGRDDTAGLRRAVEQCQRVPQPWLIFPKGQYDLADEAAVASFRKFMASAAPGMNFLEDPHYKPPDYTVGVQFRDCHGLTVDGQGSTLVVHGYTLPFSFDGCDGVTVRNLTIDFDRPPFSTGRVIASASRTLDIRVFDEFPIAGGEPVHIFQEYDAKTRKPTCREWGGVVASTELIGPQVLRLNTRCEVKIMPGAIVVMRHPIHICPDFDVVRCTRFRMEDVTVHASIGIGVLVRASRDSSLERVRVIPRPDNNRIMSSSFDATMFGFCSGTVEIKDCTFEGMGDDAFSVNNGRTTADERVDPYTFAAHFDWFDDYHFNPWWILPPEPGQHLQFMRPFTLLPYATAQVDQVQFDAATGRMRIGLRERVPDQFQSGDTFACAERNARARVFGCTFRPNRSRGILLSTQDAIVEKSKFEGTGGTALYIFSDLATGATAAGDMVVRNNEFINCGHAVANQGGSGITLDIENRAKAAGRRTAVLRNIVIEKNSFRGDSGPALAISATENVTVQNNRFDNPLPAIRIQKGCKVKLRGNGFSQRGDAVVFQ